MDVNFDKFMMLICSSSRCSSGSMVVLMLNLYCCFFMWSFMVRVFVLIFVIFVISIFFFRFSVEV